MIRQPSPETTRRFSQASLSPVVEWTVYNFECADAAARESLLADVERSNPIDLPDDGDAAHGSLVDDSGTERPVDVAWIADYVYVLAERRIGGLLARTAGTWQRAVVADFDGPTESCVEAVLFDAVDSAPVERARYEGVPEVNGQDVLYRFAMAHQFRFRAYAHVPPGPAITPLFGAFEAVAGMGWGSELMEYFERETGVAPTGPGLAFLEDDPVLDGGEYYDHDDESGDHDENGDLRDGT